MNTHNIVPIVSFPKSGNTWLRFLLANVVKKNKDVTIDFRNINDYMPTSHKENLKKVSSLLVDNAPIFIKQHYNFYTMPFHDFEKAIYIYRDGFDALYSYWHFTDAQSPGLYSSVESFSNCYWRYCGHWGEHLYSWILDENTKRKHQVLGISYERLMNDTVTALNEVVTFLDMNVSKEDVLQAVKLSDKKNMKNLTGSKEFMKSKKKDFHFVRSGNKGDAKKHLPEYCKNKFMENKLNYELMIDFDYVKSENAWLNISKKESSPLVDKLKSVYFYLKYQLLKSYL